MVEVRLHHKGGPWRSAELVLPCRNRACRSGAWQHSCAWRLTCYVIVGCVNT